VPWCSSTLSDIILGFACAVEPHRRVVHAWGSCDLWQSVVPPQRSSNAQPTLLQKLPGGVSVEAPKQNIAAGQAAVFAGLGTWAVLQVGWQQSHQAASAAVVCLCPLLDKVPANIPA
jgi:hypothetical protein